MRSTPSSVAAAAICASLASWSRVRSRSRAGAALRRGEGDVADPEGDGRLGDAELGGDVLERHVAGAHGSRLLLRCDLPAVAHVVTVRPGCDTHAMVSGSVGVGVIGRGFGRRVVAPVFAATEGWRSSTSCRRGTTRRAPLCARADVDMVAVHSPPFCTGVVAADGGRQGGAVRQAFGTSTDDAGHGGPARDAGVVALLNFEFRHHPGRRAAASWSGRARWAPSSTCSGPPSAPVPHPAARLRLAIRP